MAVLLLTASLVPDQAAAASSRLCRQLEAELASTGQGNRSSAAMRQYDRAIAEQERQLSRTEAEWQRAECDYGYGGRTARLCRQIENTLTRMERNYAELQRERARLGLGSSRNGSVERQRIQRAIDDAGCNAPAPQPKPQQVAVPRASQPDTAQERLRTLCVRMSDGYFFPMSYGVTRDDFAREAKNCQATCPSTEMRLYYHKVPDQAAADMVSADNNEPYSALPTANLYRNQPQSGASACAPAAPKATIASVPDQPVSETPKENTSAPATTSVSPVPPATTSPSIRVLPDQSTPQEPEKASEPAKQEPEKREAALPKRPPDPAPARSMSEDDKRVRVVGPTFLPAQEGAIDLRAPGQKSAP
ncbi:DUF2865 domain-containing protein [Tianweitania sp. BSSL-BM11]|uniref:DUF2865 domain-containing protein n=1 Tax=Tianweitania aestuarii TaxID=2814886 RepID=A0ABS5RX00_9HYPH|nr:DUF2865 domain-containing protein [Tianweitania aestuarii]MBS9720734.1 DUF2865 domain-containing protein [Tianweitania aestuarii]